MRLLLPVLCCLALLACAKPFACESINGLKEGVSTLQDATTLLGAAQTLNLAEDGSKVYTWRFTGHVYTGGGSITDVVLTFTQDGKLAAKRCATRVVAPLVKEPAA
jgi:hypothetical protein